LASFGVSAELRAFHFESNERWCCTRLGHVALEIGMREEKTFFGVKRGD